MNRDHHFYLDKLKNAVETATAETQWDNEDIPRALDLVLLDGETLLIAAKVRFACDWVVTEARRPNSSIASVAMQKVQAMAAIEQLRVHLDRTPGRYEESA